MSYGLPFSDDPFNTKHVLDPTAALLPASTRTVEQTLICPSDDMHSFLQKDLRVDKLNKIDRYLWLAGQPMPPRPLNYHVVASREIAADERMDMHLVWETSRRLHLKPLPRYLLDGQFWAKHLVCEGSDCVEQDQSAHGPSRQTREHLYKCALGFLASYIALIQFESDIAIAHSYHLIPRDLTWEKWVQLVQQLLKKGATNPKNINHRYLFGELRLARLNEIYAIRYGSILKGYQFTYQTYGELVRDHLTTLSAATIYVALVLTAMQVGLATTRLGQNLSFQNASYGFTVFSILAPLIGIGLVGMMGIFQFASNMLETRRFKHKQFALYDKMAQNHSI
ncbi:hypothetical protein N7474_002589 [Penicillium riverlandense]|uniref:uncharacterized protein n=1 Tax=Penicillium riverlandense TaxID=1903569 RepID=UPI002547CAAD|nr:uncharacterized protein N7474_002589 [Penicillium riverlandense]KAJ5825451.1 hypothetical protein N7474_002589 [Penicillium riverlandense]